MQYFPPSKQAEGATGIKELGHRVYVGGVGDRWESIGKLQFNFMIRMGLQSSHVFMDIACGSLRGGQFFIPYLEAGHYLGIDKEQGLIDAGLREEVDPLLVEQKRPEFVVSSDFEFDKFSKIPDMSLAQSLFSHLTEKDCIKCLKSLRDFVKPGHIFCATFYVGDIPTLGESHSFTHFEFPVAKMKEMGRDNGWNPTYIGDIGHPWDQMMMKFVAE